MPMTWKKVVIPNPKLYISRFVKNKENPYLVFIHGGPGLNSGVLEYLIENESLFGSLNYNIVLYDQRGCGRSKTSSEVVSHVDNINDLNLIYRSLIEEEDLKIQGCIGHSYGAKLLFDFYQTFKPRLPGIFVSIADSMLTPRLRNLILDFNYLKSKDVDKYKAIYRKMSSIDLGNFWELTEDLTPLFFENKDRPYMYWANLDYFEKVENIQKQINLPINKQVFMDVRKNLYSNRKNLPVNIEKLTIPYLWINGIHDYIMNGTQGLSENSKVTPFFKSSHYPHLEENDRFCEVVNEFIEAL
ncbi:MAG: alpha/beta hydrolase [Gammaproteobacteria bacterium]